MTSSPEAGSAPWSRGEIDLPGVDSVFRIASMTKSFTGAALMTLVAEGKLSLDDAVAQHVPELAGWRGPTTDAPPLTVRNLVSMASGLPTDDPWADRHLDLTDEGMDASDRRRGEVRVDSGREVRVLEPRVGPGGQGGGTPAGKRVQQAVSEVLLEPLGMTATTWERPTTEGVAEPHRLQDDGREQEAPPLGDGTIAPMGGLWSSVRDLARWVGFFTDAFPPRPSPMMPHCHGGHDERCSRSLASTSSPACAQRPPGRRAWR